MVDAKRSVIKIDLDKDLTASVDRLKTLQGDREPKDIPIADEYWKAVKKHRLAFNKKD